MTTATSDLRPAAQPLGVVVDANVLLCLAQSNHGRWRAAPDGVVAAHALARHSVSRRRTLPNSGQWRRGRSGRPAVLILRLAAVADEIGTIEKLFRLTADDPAICPI
jgi:hypothetical protein